MSSQQIVVVTLALAFCACAHSESNAPPARQSFLSTGSEDARVPANGSLVWASGSLAATSDPSATASAWKTRASDDRRDARAARAAASGARAPSPHARAAGAKPFRIASGLVELRGTLRVTGARAAEVDLALDVHSATRSLHAVYEYRVRVDLERDEAIELGVNDRRMYALVPRTSRVWSDLAASDADISDELELVRLDGAGEER
jgi:hypothetical protein